MTECKEHKSLNCSDKGNDVSHKQHSQKHIWKIYGVLIGKCKLDYLDSSASGRLLGICPRGNEYYYHIPIGS